MSKKKIPSKSDPFNADNQKGFQFNKVFKVNQKQVFIPILLNDQPIANTRLTSLCDVKKKHTVGQQDSRSYARFWDWAVHFQSNGFSTEGQSCEY